MVPLPYVGVTGFMDAGQVEKISEVFNYMRGSSSVRRLHVGVMMSYRTLNKQLMKYAHVFPSNEDVAKIFYSDETMNCLHYADYRSIDVSQSLVRAIGFGGIGINALQLDMIWPDPADVANAVHASRKQLEVILQVGKNALEQVKNDPHEVVERLRDYCGVIHHVLLDKSMGQGLGMDAQALLPFVREIKEFLPWLSISAAGGLGPYTLQLVEPIIREFPTVSVDAQGQLCPDGDMINPMSVDLAALYTLRALQMLA